MKRYITFILFIFITVGTWASGASEQNSVTTYRFYTEKLDFNNIESNLADGLQVQPSDTIIGVLDDYIYDVLYDINADLVSAVKENNVDKTFMILGDTKIICVRNI